MVEKIIVSACLLGECCRYDGKSSENESIQQYVRDKEVFALCPEVMGGLCTPRPCCEKKGEKVFDENGCDQSAAFVAGAEAVLAIAKQHNIKTAILKSKSPSCGYGKIYSGDFNGKLVDGMGICAALLKNNAIKIINSEEFSFKMKKETKKAL